MSSQVFESTATSKSDATTHQDRREIKPGRECCEIRCIVIAIVILSFVAFATILAIFFLRRIENRIEDLERCGTITDPVLIDPSVSELSSYGFGDRAAYPNRLDCYYLVDLGNNPSLEIKVMSFDLMKSPNCAKESLSILNLGEKKELVRLCGSLPAGKQIFTAKREKILIRYNSERIYRKKGFKIKFDRERVAEDDSLSRTKQESYMPQRTYYANKGTIKSKDYPKPFANKPDFLLKIRPEDKETNGIYKVRVEYESASIKSACTDSNMLIVDLNEENEMSNAAFWCPEKFNHPFFTDNPNFDILFHNESANVQNTAFKIMFEFFTSQDPSGNSNMPVEAQKPVAICGTDNIRRNSGQLDYGRVNLMDEGRNYPKNCSTRVNSKDKRPFEITIEHLNFDVGDKECGEYFVQISDAFGVLTRQCGGEIYEASFKTRSSWFEVSVLSDGSMRSASLLISYKTIETSSTPPPSIGNQDNKTCGVRLPPSGPYASAIVGGTVSKKNSWPWQVSLVFDLYPSCGGSLINNQWILTAAHCFDDSSDPTRWMALIGDFNLQTIERSEQLVSIASIIMHPNYDSVSTDSDYALVKLARPIAFSQFASPVCLPQQDDELPPDGSNCYVTGWGDTGTDEASPTLRQVQLEIISTASCRETGYQSRDITANMFCAGVEAGGKDSCQGDSGGPLVYFDKESQSFVQLGIVSWGIGCASPDFPGVYSRVSQVVDWIDQTVFENQ